MAIYRNVAANTVRTVNGKRVITREETNVVTLPVAPQPPEIVTGEDAGNIDALHKYIVSLREHIVMLQSKLLELTRTVNSNKSNTAITIKDVSIVLGDTDVSHLLGKAYTGWRICRINGAQTVYEASTQPDRTKFLRLTGTGTATVDVEIW